MSQPPEAPKKPNRHRLRSFTVSIAAAVLIAMLVKATIAESFYIATDAVAPEVPEGSRLIACKLCRSLTAGDIVVYRDDGTNLVGRVTAVDGAADTVTVDRNDQAPVEIDREQIVGRVVAQSR
jgi:hypothetical protein